MLGKRQYFRVKGNHQVRWETVERVNGKILGGGGTVSNISVSGMELTVAKDFKLPDGCVLFLEPADEEIVPLQSHRAKVVWSKEISKNGAQALQCGLVFIEEFFEHKT